MEKYLCCTHPIQEPDSAVATISHELHRNRRAALNPCFSKASTRRLEPTILDTFNNLLRRLNACAKSGEIMPFSAPYKAATSDIITLYCFGVSTNFLTRQDYNTPFLDAVAESFGLAWWLTHIAWLGPLLYSIPVTVKSMLMPGLNLSSPNSVCKLLLLMFQVSRTNENQ